MPRKAPDAQMRRAREPHPCSRAPPSVLAKVTSTQSPRAGAPLVSAYAPRPATASTATASSVPTTAFSRLPQRSGSDSRRCCSNMIMPEGYSRETRSPGVYAAPGACSAAPCFSSVVAEEAGSNASASELMQ